MGTNYYLHTNICPHCGRSEEVLHIGKSSAGWCFALHVTDELTSLNDWIDLMILDPTSKVYNEYGDEIPVSGMLDIIRKRAWKRELIPSTPLCQKGPNNLLRYKIDGNHCIGHGEGTWDLIKGDFS